jgi:hypothetical protein
MTPTRGIAFAFFYTAQALFAETSAAASFGLTSNIYLPNASEIAFSAIGSIIL